MSCSSFFAYFTCFGCFGAAFDSEPEEMVEEVEMVPVRRARMVYIKTVRTHLPIKPQLVPTLDVSVSSSTSTAMFDSARISAVAESSPLTNPFTSPFGDEFEDVDLSDPITFSAPPKEALKASPASKQSVQVDFALEPRVSPFDDQFESDDAADSDDDKTLCDHNVEADADYELCSSPFSDQCSVESQPEVVYAPTSSYPADEYTQRAMEYQRGKSTLLCPFPSLTRACS
jgi:hypothetical protein